MIIRTASRADADSIRTVHLAAFPEEEAEQVASLAVELLELGEGLSLVAEENGSIVGNVVFSPVRIEDGTDWKGCILAPLGVNPATQSQGLGSRLVEEGKRRLAELGVQIVFVYGDPAYYGRFGFSAEAAVQYRAPHPLQFPFGWQAIELGGGAQRSSAVTIECVEPLNKPEMW